MKKAPKISRAISEPVYAPDYGRISLSENEIKELPDWKPGEKYEFTVKAELTELSIDEYTSNPKDKGKVRGRFKITSVKNVKS